jgi:hypothetical protein
MAASSENKPGAAPRRCLRCQQRIDEYAAGEQLCAACSDEQSAGSVSSQDCIHPRIALPPPGSFKEFYWIGDPACDGIGEKERLFIDRRADVQLIAGACADLSYEFDETAVCRLDGKFYVLNTSGCSCPSPSEKWGVAYGPIDTLAEVAKTISGDKAMYMPDDARADLLAQLVAEVARGN